MSALDLPGHYFDNFEEDLSDPVCVQQIYDFALVQVRGLVDYNDEDDVIQEVFYRLTKWPIGKKYNSKSHYFSLLKITIRQAIAAYWKRRHSQRNDVRKRKFISELQNEATRFDFDSNSESVVHRLHVKEVVHLVLEKVKSLNPRQRKMFELRFMKELSHEDISKQMKISVRTAYRWESKVRQLLQEMINPSNAMRE